MKKSFRVLVSCIGMSLALTACGAGNTSNIVSSGNALQVKSVRTQATNTEAFVLPVTQQNKILVIEDKVVILAVEKTAIKDKSLEIVQLQSQISDEHSCGQ